MKIMPNSEQLHLVWNNHMSNMQNVLFELYNHPTLADVTISCKDGTLKAHKIILSACSPYFETVFQENPCKHPVVILKETSRNEMQMLLQFMYKGATDIPEDDMLSVIHTANELRVKGFAHAANRRGSTENSDITPTDNREVLKDVAQCNKHLEVVQNLGRNSVEEAQTESKAEHDGQAKCDKVKSMATTKEKDTRISTLHSNKENDTESSENSEKGVHLTDSISDTKSPSYSTRFRGRKRVAVGYGGRPRSTDKKEQEKGLTMSMRSTVKKAANSKSVGNSVSTKLRSTIADTSKRKLSSDSEDDRLISCIPDIEIKEEVDDLTDYSFMQSDYSVKECDRDQYIKEEPIDHLLLRNPDFLYYDDDDFESDHVGKKSSALKPHECEFCELSFARASHLARHRRVHTGERPFSCEICQCRFSRQDKLKQHTRRHHPIDIQIAVQKKSSDKRKRGRPRKIQSETLIPTTERTEETNVSLPFGDTSYLSSLSLGQQRYKDQVASLEAASSSNAEDLLQTVRQLGECTIQAVPTCKFNV